MKVALALSMIALTLCTVPASAGPFFRIVDNYGNTISQPTTNYPYPQASFQVDGCSEIFSGSVLVRSCTNALDSVETSLIGGGRSCTNQLFYPFAEVSDPCFTQGVNYAVAGCCAAGTGAGYTYHMTAAATAPGGLVFKSWAVHYYQWSAVGYDPFSSPTIPCQEGNGSLSCTVTLPADSTTALIFPILTYSPYSFGGFQPPVSPSALNVVKAGSAVPIQFSLGGNFGLSILAANSPAFQPASCSSSQPTSTILDTLTAGGSSLAYDATSNTYTYVWKTDQSWAGTCGQFVLGLNDGTSYAASFQFR